MDPFKSMKEGMSLSIGIILLIAALFPAFVCSKPQFNLPSGADELLKDPLSEDFSCENRTYGYYADFYNNCQLFHVCLPIKDTDGEVTEITQYTFLCSNGTLFDQQTLSCNFEDDIYPCENAADLFGDVKFGEVEE